MSKTRILIHLVFCTKRREATIDEDKESELFAYLAGIINNLKCKAICVGGYRNHIHILMNLSPSLSVSEVVRSVKSNSSRWLAENWMLPNFCGWAKEYFASSVSSTHLENVKGYILGQREHHKIVDTEEELWKLCTKSGLTLHEDDFM